jgi:CRP/FNR family transcriptional regulator, cyclic AMP receptor protein
MVAKKQYLQHLRNVSLFSGCSDRDLAKIAKAADEVDVPAGHMLADQGQTGREAFILVQGTATVRRNGKKVAVLGPGAVIGELSLLDHGPRTATVTTDEASTVLVLDQRHFSAVIDDVPTIGHKIMGVLASRIRDLDRQIYG